jgi:hypothetical protein
MWKNQSKNQKCSSKIRTSVQEYKKQRVPLQQNSSWSALQTAIFKTHQKTTEKIEFTGGSVKISMKNQQKY